MSNLSVDKIDHTNTALKGASGGTGGASSVSVSATFNGIATGGNMKVTISGDTWTASVTPGDGDFTPPGPLTVTVKNDSGDHASKTDHIA